MKLNIRKTAIILRLVAIMVLTIAPNISATHAGERILWGVAEVKTAGEMPKEITPLIGEVTSLINSKLLGEADARSFGTSLVARRGQLSIGNGVTFSEFVELEVAAGRTKLAATMDGLIIIQDLFDKQREKAVGMFTELYFMRVVVAHGAETEDNLRIIFLVDQLDNAWTVITKDVLVKFIDPVSEEFTVVTAPMMTVDYDGKLWGLGSLSSQIKDIAVVYQ
ncbi:MAG: hypothetical protein ACTSYA_04240 [Candidatus Kariarchaeaceae archaeon]